MINNAAIIFVGTSEYKNYFESFYNKVKNYFLKDTKKTFFIFTDDVDFLHFQKNDVISTKIEHEKWPLVSLKRFEYISRKIEELSEFDWVFFIDADLHPNEEITFEEIDISNPFLGVDHPGFFENLQNATFERRRESSSFVPLDQKIDHYWQGCFWGVRKDKLRYFIEKTMLMANNDLKNGIVAIWFDESILNRFFITHNKEVTTLHPGFATPEIGYELIKSRFPKKLIHLSKDNLKLHR